MERAARLWPCCPGDGGVTVPGGVPEPWRCGTEERGQWARWGGLGLEGGRARGNSLPWAVLLHSTPAAPSAAKMQDSLPLLLPIFKNILSLELTYMNKAFTNLSLARRLNLHLTQQKAARSIEACNGGGRHPGDGSFYPLSLPAFGTASGSQKQQSAVALSRRTPALP